jgi:hypothetical protein
LQAPPDVPILVCEGEKVCDAVNAAADEAGIALVATTSPHGASNAHHSDWSPLKGRRVIICPDNDGAGREYAKKVAELARKAEAAEVRIFDLAHYVRDADQLPEGADLADVLEAEGWLGLPLPEGSTAADALRFVLQNAAAAELHQGQEGQPADGELDAVAALSGYRIRNNHFERYMKTDGVWVPMTNFCAKIVRETVRDDGWNEPTLYYTIEGILDNGQPNGEPLEPIEVSCVEFVERQWWERWGSRVRVFVGHQNHHHLRDCVKAHSNADREMVYAHLGWRIIGDQPAFLHAGGAITAAGNRDDIRVNLPNQLGRVELPQPPEGNDLKDAILATIYFAKLEPRTVTVPLLAATFRAALGPGDLILWITGPTGVRKTSVVKTAQAFYGRALVHSAPLESWNSTQNHIMATLNRAKNIAALIDDFTLADAQSRAGVNALLETVNRVVRNAANGTGRGRCGPDGRERNTRPPRGIPIITGEDIPIGQSVLARAFVIRLATAIDGAELAKRQQDAADGKYTACMAAFLRRLASSHAEIARKISDLYTSELPEELQSDRTAIYQMALNDLGNQGHTRLPWQLADLGLGLRYFLRFAVDSGAIDREDAESLWAEWWWILVETARSEVALQRESDPVKRFLEILAQGLAAGEMHLTDMRGGEPMLPGATMQPGEENFSSGLGWRNHEAKGRHIGWIDVGTGDVFLIPSQAYAAVAELSRHSAPLGVTERTLYRLLAERGLLESVDAEQHTVRIMVNGQRHRVLHLKLDTIRPTE